MFQNAVRLFRRFTGSLRFKLSFSAGIVMFLAVVAFTYHSISTQEDNLVNARIQSALKDSDLVKASIWHGMMTKDRDLIRETVKVLGQQEGIKEINLYDREGVLHYSSKAEAGELPGEHTRVPEAVDLLRRMEENPRVRYQFSDEGNLLTVYNPLANIKSCSSAACHADPESEKVLGALEVKLPLQGLRTQILDNARKTVIFAFLLFLLISTIIGVGVIFLVSRPLRRLGNNAKKMARGEYVPEKTQMSGTDSISALYRTFDEMSRQINERTHQLEQSRRMYKELFEKVPCYLTVVNKDFEIVRANQAFKDEFGDQVGKNCYAGFKGQDTKCEHCQVERTFADGFSHRSDEIWTLGNRGKKAYVIVNTTPIMDEEGKVVEVLEMAVDVTRLEKLQIELKRKEEQFKNLFENVPCYLTVIDRAFRIGFYNKMFARDFGESWGKHCFATYKGSDRQCEDCPVEKTFVDGNSHSSEEVWSQNGNEVHVIVQTSPITDESGAIVAVMEMCTNVTELKSLQNELSVLGETIAGMSHTVKNILSGLEGGVYVVDSGLKAGRNDKVTMGWDMVKKNVEKVSDLVKDILYASKERKPEYEECDPAKVLAEVYDLYVEKASAKGVELVRDFEPELAVGFLDPRGLHSVVSNLLSNAIAACSASLQRETYHVILSGVVENGKVVIQVTDDGCGMPDEIKHNLFKKFFSTKGSKGTGLGLVVTKKIVEEHGGTIRVASRPGEGTTFSVEIPLRPAPSRDSLRKAV
jgi:PAS domain S-box-containing protein